LAKKIISIIPAVLVILLIAAFTLQPGEASSALTMRFVRVVAGINNRMNNTQADWSISFSLVRKFAHSFEYLAMGGAAVCCCLVWVRRHPYLVAVVFCVVVSICDQLSKIAVPGREFDITDIPFDVMGYLIGIMAFYIIRLEWKRHRRVQEA